MLSEIQCVMGLKKQKCFLFLVDKTRLEQVAIKLRYVDSKGMLMKQLASSTEFDEIYT